MPHKHKRRGTNGDASFDLPPNSIAKPLPTFSKAVEADNPKRKDSKPQSARHGKKPRKLADDTPRAFAQLLNFQKTGKRLPPALDDGNTTKGKKRKRDTDDPTNTKTSKPLDQPTATTVSSSEQPSIKILPGERLSDFSARVDQALPIAGLKTKGQHHPPKIPGVKIVEQRKTKHNRRLERMQKAWREEEARRREKLEQEMEEKEEEREEEQLLWRGVGSGKRKERRKGEGNQEEEDDPWAELEKKRKESKQKNLQDVVQAPPQLKGVKGRLKEYGSGGGVGVDVRDVPGRVGSLRKREEVGALRRSVIDGYRKMMGSKTVKL